MTKPLFDNENSFYAEINRIVDEINNGYYTKEDIGNNNYTKQEIDNLLIDYVKTTELTNELNNYYNKTYINDNYYDKNAVDLLIKTVNGINVDDLVNKTELTETLKDYATKTELNNIDLSGMYTKAETDNKIDERITAIINAAPSNLDTLGEVAQAIQDNETVVEALQQAIGNKADKDNVQANTTETPTTALTNLKVGDTTYSVVSKFEDLSNDNFTFNYDGKILEAKTSSYYANTYTNVKRSIVLGYQNKLLSGASESLQFTITLGTKNEVGGGSTREALITCGRYLNNKNNNDRIVCGYGNVDRNNTYFEVGYGSSSARKNAFEVYADGHSEVDVMGTTDKSVANKKYVDDNINTINADIRTIHSDIAVCSDDIITINQNLNTAKNDVAENTADIINIYDRLYHTEAPKLLHTFNLVAKDSSVNIDPILQIGKAYLIYARQTQVDYSDCKMVVFANGSEFFSLSCMDKNMLNQFICVVSRSNIDNIISNVEVKIYEIGTE